MSTKTTKKTTKPAVDTEEEETEPEVESTASEPEICINPIDFDPARVVVRDPQQSEFTLKSGNKIKSTTSPIRYLDDEDRECVLYVRGDPQYTYGFSYNHEMKIAKDDRTPENANGVQVCYPLTSRATVQNPKPTEQALRDTFMGLWQAVVDKCREEVEKDDTLLPDVAKNPFIAAAKKGQWERAVKLPFSRPKDKNDKSGKKFDTSKPESIYTKLVTSGEGKSMKVSTVIRGPGDKVQSALRYVDVSGILEPVWICECAYHGAHGSEAPYGTSLRIKLVQGNFTPKAFSRVPQHRMLPRNTAPVQEEDEGVYPGARGAQRDEEGEDEGFSAPGEDSSNPASALATASKGKPKSKAVAPKAKAKAVAAKAKTVLATVPPKGKAVAAKAVAKPAGKAKAKAAPAKPKAKAKPVPVEDPEEEEEVDEETPLLEDEEEVEEDEE